MCHWHEVVLSMLSGVLNYLEVYKAGSVCSEFDDRPDQEFGG